MSAFISAYPLIRYAAMYWFVHWENSEAPKTVRQNPSFFVDVAHRISPSIAPQTRKVLILYWILNWWASIIFWFISWSTSRKSRQTYERSPLWRQADQFLGSTTAETWIAAAAAMDGRLLAKLDELSILSTLRCAPHITKYNESKWERTIQMGASGRRLGVGRSILWRPDISTRYTAAIAKIGRRVQEGHGKRKHL
jgi:hypothetical protein